MRSLRGILGRLAANFAWAGLMVLAGPGFSQTAAKAPEAKIPMAPSAKAPEVKTSTATAPTVSGIYTADRLRDPFQRATSGGGGAAAGKAFAPEDFNIHNLSLRGVMKDAAADYALLVDSNFGVSFVLRKGKLYDEKGKVVPGVTGSLNIKQKTASLMTREKDVQVFRLGEEGKE